MSVLEATFIVYFAIGALLWIYFRIKSPDDSPLPAIGDLSLVNGLLDAIAKDVRR